MEFLITRKTRKTTSTTSTGNGSILIGRVLHLDFLTTAAKVEANSFKANTVNKPTNGPALQCPSQEKLHLLHLISNALQLGKIHDDSDVLLGIEKRKWISN